jgi:hypothetical protein
VGVALVAEAHIAARARYRPFRGRVVATHGRDIVLAIMSSLTGNAGPLGLGEAHDEFGRLLGPGEQIYAAFEFVRDVILFTNARLVLVDKQGVTGKKVEYHSIPYRNVSHFSVETVGHFDGDAELKVWIVGEKDPIKKEFNEKVDIYQVQAILSAFVVSR